MYTHTHRSGEVKTPLMTNPSIAEGVVLRKALLSWNQTFKIMLGGGSVRMLPRQASNTVAPLSSVNIVDFFFV